MGIKITSVGEALENNGIKILIHGLAGAGKTVFCATTGVPTLIISAESGLLSIAGAPDFIQTTVVKTIYELEQVYDYLAGGDHPFKAAALDSVSEIAEVLLADEKKNSKDPRQAYGNLSDRMLSILRGFRDLPDMDIIMSCKQVRVQDPDTNVTRYVPSLPGQALTNSIGYLFDEVFALRVEKDEDGDDYRTIQTGRDRNYEAKDRSGVLDMFEEPSARLIFAKIREAMPEESDELTTADLAEAKKLMDDKKYKGGDLSDAYEPMQEDTMQDDTEHLNSTEANKERLEESIEQVEQTGSVEDASEDNEDEAEQETEEKGTNIIENNTDKVMYLYHNTSDAVLKLPAGDFIDDDGNIDVVDFKTFVEHSKRIKAENE